MTASGKSNKSFNSYIGQSVNWRSPSWGNQMKRKKPNLLGQDTTNATPKPAYARSVKQYGPPDDRSDARKIVDYPTRMGLLFLLWDLGVILAKFLAKIAIIVFMALPALFYFGGLPFRWLFWKVGLMSRSDVYGDDY